MMIFNKDNNGTIEVKDVVGFIYKSIIFDNLRPFINFSESTLKKVIGKDLFTQAEEHYKSENYKSGKFPVLDELVNKIQYPVALNAYQYFAKTTDVTHSGKGRQIFVSNTEKPAFEWQIERDDENLISLYYQSVDFLLEFLDDHIDDKAPDSAEPLIPWGNSPIYLDTKKLFINSVKEFDKVFSIMGSRRLFLSLVPFMTRIQENEIRICFNENKYSEIREQIIDKDLTDQNKIIVDLAGQAQVLLSLAMAIRRLPVEVLPEGIFLNQVTGVIKAKAGASKIDRNEVSVTLEKDGRMQLKKLQNILHEIDLKEQNIVEVPADINDCIDPDQKYVRF